MSFFFFFVWSLDCFCYGDKAVWSTPLQDRAVWSTPLQDKAVWSTPLQDKAVRLTTLMHNRCCWFVCLSRPNTGPSPYEEERTDLLQRYNSISADDAGQCVCVRVCARVCRTFHCGCLFSLVFLSQNTVGRSSMIVRKTTAFIQTVALVLHVTVRCANGFVFFVPYMLSLGFVVIVDVLCSCALGGKRS